MNNILLYITMPYFFRVRDIINTEDNRINKKWLDIFLFALVDFAIGCRGNVVIFGVLSKKIHKVIPIISYGNINEFEYKTEESIGKNNVKLLTGLTRSLSLVELKEIENFIKTMTTDEELLEFIDKRQNFKPIFNMLLKHASKELTGKYPNILYIHITCEKNIESIQTNGLVSEAFAKNNPDMLVGDRGSRRIRRRDRDIIESNRDSRVSIINDRVKNIYGDSVYSDRVKDSRDRDSIDKDRDSIDRDRDMARGIKNTTRRRKQKTIRKPKRKGKHTRRYRKRYVK
jgi:hypothetical protein